MWYGRADLRIGSGSVRWAAMRSTQMKSAAFGSALQRGCGLSLRFRPGWRAVRPIPLRSRRRSTGGWHPVPVGGRSSRSEFFVYVHASFHHLSAGALIFSTACRGLSCGHIRKTRHALPLGQQTCSLWGQGGPGCRVEMSNTNPVMSLSTQRSILESFLT